MENGHSGPLDLPPDDDSAQVRQLPPLASTPPVSGDGARAADPSKGSGGLGEESLRQAAARQAAARRASLLSFHDVHDPAIETEMDMELPGTPSKETRPSDSHRDGEGRETQKLPVNSGWATEDPSKWGSSPLLMHRKMEGELDLRENGRYRSRVNAGLCHPLAVVLVVLLASTSHLVAL